MSATRSTLSKGHSNPYARPLSAKDIVNDLQNQKMRKSPSAHVNPSNNFMIQGGTGTPMFGFQMNSFMRPQSALKKDPPSSPPKPDTKNHNFSSNGTAKPSDQGSRRAISEEEDRTQSTKAQNSTRKQGLPPTKLEREKDLSETLFETGAKTVGQVTKNIFGPAKSALNVAKEPEKPGSNMATRASTGSSGSSFVSNTKVTTACQTPNSAVSKMHEASNAAIKKVVSKSSDTNPIMPSKSVIYAKPVSSLPRPGSAAAPSGPKPLTPESPAKVRNLNYTPTKPYSEVMDPTPNPSSTAVTGKPPVSNSTKIQQTAETAISVKQDTVKHGTTYMAPNNIDKHKDDKHRDTKTHTAGSSSSSASSKESITNSGTHFYRKESRTELMIHEQRPPAVGAPAKQTKLPEKGSRTTLTSGMSGSEIDDLDDESEPGIPSG